jgi:hypothetical protein
MADNIIDKTKILPSMYLMTKTKHMQIIPFIVTISFSILVVDLTDIFVLKNLLRKSLYMTPDKVFKNAAIVLERNTSWKSTVRFLPHGCANNSCNEETKNPWKILCKIHHIIWSQLVTLCNLFSDEWVAVGILCVDSETNENAKCNDQGERQAKINDRPIRTISLFVVVRYKRYSPGSIFKCGYGQKFLYTCRITTNLT